MKINWRRMLEILRTDYWSKADSFLLPLTGLQQSYYSYEVKSYLFWKDYNIFNYNLILSVKHEDTDSFLRFCKKNIFPILDKSGYLLESYDYHKQTVYVLDMSEWAMDIETFLSGRYSKLSNTAKRKIIDYHTMRGGKVPLHIYPVLYPSMEMEQLAINGKPMTPISYVSRMYGLIEEDVQEIGEIGTVYQREKEKLTVLEEELCQDDSDVEMV